MRVHTHTAETNLMKARDTNDAGLTASTAWLPSVQTSALLAASRRPPTPASLQKVLRDPYLHHSRWARSRPHLDPHEAPEQEVQKQLAYRRDVWNPHRAPLPARSQKECTQEHAHQNDHTSSTCPSWARVAQSKLDPCRPCPAASAEKTKKCLRPNKHHRQPSQNGLGETDICQYEHEKQHSQNAQRCLASG